MTPFPPTYHIKNYLTSYGLNWKITYAPGSKHNLCWEATPGNNIRVYATSERDLYKEIRKLECGWVEVQAIARDYPEWFVNYERLSVDHFEAERGYCKLSAKTGKRLREKIDFIESQVKQAEERFL